MFEILKQQELASRNFLPKPQEAIVTSRKFPAGVRDVFGNSETLSLEHGKVSGKNNPFNVLNP